MKQLFPPMAFPPLIPSDDKERIAYSIGDPIDILLDNFENKYVIEKAMLLNLMNEISQAKEEVYKKAMPANVTFESEVSNETSKR